MHKSLTGDDVAEARAELAAYDIDSDGYIDASEFQKLLQSRDTRLSPAQIRNVFERIDLDGDGLIDLAEFRRWS